MWRYFNIKYNNEMLIIVFVMFILYSLSIAFFFNVIPNNIHLDVSRVNEKTISVIVMIVSICVTYLTLKGFRW